MSRACSVCHHPRQRDIDAALLSGGSMRDVAGQFAIAKSNLSRHVPHVQATVRAAQSSAAGGPVLEVARILAIVNSVCIEVMSRARERDPRLVLLAAGAITRQLEFSHGMEQDAASRDLLERIERLEQALSEPATNGAAHWAGVA